MEEEEYREEHRFSACLQCTQHCYQTHGRGDFLSRFPSFCTMVMESLANPVAHTRLQIPPAFVTERNLKLLLESGTSSNFECHLEGPNGQIWPVTVEGWTSLSFTKGWKTFAVDHSLSVGDFLTFKLISKGLFAVQIYGANGCEKANSLMMQNNGLSFMPHTPDTRKRKLGGESDLFVGSESECKRSKVMEVDPYVKTPQKMPVIINLDDDDEDDEVSILDDSRCSSVQQLITCKQVPIHESTALASDCTVQEYVTESEEGLKSSTEELVTDCKDRLGTEKIENLQLPESGINRSSEQEINTELKNQVGPENIENLPLPQSNEDTEQTVKSNTEVNQCHSLGPKSAITNSTETLSQVCLERIQNCSASQISGSPKSAIAVISGKLSDVMHETLQNYARDYLTEVFVSQRRAVSGAEREQALLAARRFRSTRPYLRKIMKESHVYRGFWLSFSKGFSSKYLPSYIQVVTLLDSSGKTWSAKWLGSRNGLSGGWRKFSLDHGLEEGDVCVFEIMDRKKIVIKVHIFRVVELKDGLPGRDHFLRIPQARSCDRRYSLSQTPKTSQKRKDLIGPCHSQVSSTLKKKMRGAVM